MDVSNQVVGTGSVKSPFDVSVPVTTCYNRVVESDHSGVSALIVDAASSAARATRLSLIVGDGRIRDRQRSGVMIDAAAGLRSVAGYRGVVDCQGRSGIEDAAALPGLGIVALGGDVVSRDAAVGDCSGTAGSVDSSTAICVVAFATLVAYVVIGNSSSCLP